MRRLSARATLLVWLLLLGGCRTEGRPAPADQVDAQQPALTASAPQVPAVDEAPEGPAKALVLRIINGASAPRYLDESANLEPITCQVQRGQSWERCHLFEPYCTFPCTLGNEEQPIPECARPRPRVRRIDSGAHHDAPWPGTLFELNGYCYREVPAPAGRYRLRACLSPSVLCDPTDCRGLEREGVLHDNVAVSGEGECVEVEVTLPRGEERLELLFGAPR